MEDRNKTMVLPELSRTMAYTTRKTVNRLARKQPHLNRGAGDRNDQRRSKPIHRARET